MTSLEAKHGENWESLAKENWESLAEERVQVVVERLVGYEENSHQSFYNMLSRTHIE